MTRLIGAIKAMLPHMEKALQTRRALGIPDEAGEFPRLFAQLQGELAVAEAQAIEQIPPSSRLCQNCGHTFHQLGCTHSNRPFFWCPSCGSIRTCEGDEHRPGHTPRVVKVGVLVAAGLHSAFEMIAGRQVAAGEAAERILVVPVEKSAEAKGRELWGKLVASDQYPPYHSEEK